MIVFFFLLNEKKKVKKDFIFKATRGGIFLKYF